jgi:hypothetical protein
VLESGQVVIPADLNREKTSVGNNESALAVEVSLIKFLLIMIFIVFVINYEIILKQARFGVSKYLVR